MRTIVDYRLRIAVSPLEAFSRRSIGCISLDQVGIELVLADDLAEAIADGTARSVPANRLWRRLL